MIDLNKLLTTIAIKFAHRKQTKTFIEETPRFGLPDYTVSSVYKQEQIERIIVRPNSLISKEDHLEIDNEFRKYYFVQRIPDYLNPTTFAEMLSLDDVDVEVAYKLYPKSAYDKASDIKDNLKILGGQLLEARNENYHTRALQKIMAVQEEALAKLEAGNENSFRERIFVIVKADSKKKLDYSADYLEKFLKGKNVVIKALNQLQADSYMETLPIGVDNWIIPGREILSEQIESRYMLVKPQVLVDRNSMIWGYDQNGLPFFFNQWEECPAYNWMLTGMTGQGKSVLAKTVFVNQNLMNFDENGDFNGSYVIIDPNQEYEDVVLLTNGVYIKLGADADTKLNILDCLNLTRGEKITQLETIFPLLFGGSIESSTENQWTVIRKALVKCYEAKGISHDYHISKGYKDQPTLNDLYLQVKVDQAQMEKGSTLRQAYDAVLNRLTKFVNVDGEFGQFAFMAEPTKNLNFLNLERMAFSVQGVDRSIKAAYMWLIIDTLWKKIESNRRNALDDEKASRILILIDEFHMFNDNKVVLNALNQIAATIRKYNGSLGVISQRISTYKEGSGDGEGSSILANTHVKICLAQDDIEAATIGRMYNLDHATIDKLQTLGLGQYFIMIRAKKYKINRFLTNRVFAKGLELFETNAQRILDNKKKQAKEKSKIMAKYNQAGIDGIRMYFKNSRAEMIFKTLKKKEKLSDKEKKQLAEYQREYDEYGLKALSPSELTTFQYIQFREAIEKKAMQEIKPTEKEVSMQEIHEKQQFYYLVDQLDARSVEELENMGYFMIRYRLSPTDSITYLTKIQSHKHMTQITKKEVSDYGSAKNAGNLKADVKHAIDHHMMQVHAHSILAQYVDPKDIKMFDSVEADIEFKGPGEKLYAIEAETGSQLGNAEKLRGKIEHNNKRYGNNWVVYVPKAEIVGEYVSLLEKYGDLSTEEAKSRVFYRTTIKEYIDNLFVGGDEK